MPSGRWLSFPHGGCIVSIGGAGWVPGGKPRGRFGCQGNGLWLSPPSPLWESYWGMKKGECDSLSAPCPTPVRGAGSAPAVGSHGLGTSAAFGGGKHCSAPRVQRRGCLHACQNNPAWGKGELLIPSVGFCAFSPSPDLLGRGGVQDGAGAGRVDAALLKNPLAREAGGCCYLPALTLRGEENCGAGRCTGVLLPAAAI